MSRVFTYRPLHAGDLALGVNMQSNYDDAAFLDQAQALGASIVRLQIGWEAVENYATGALTLPARAATALAAYAQRGIKPIIVAAYGPPRAAVTTLTVTAAVSAGATVVPVSGNLTPVTAGVDCHVLRSSGGGQITNRRAYYGSLVAGVDAAASTITLAAALSVDLAVGDSLTVNKLRYPSLDTASPTSAGAVAFVRYAAFLAQKIADAGCQGYVNLWNEPPWASDRWDARSAFYDTPPAGLHSDERLTPLIGAALAAQLPAGVRFINGASDKTGSSGMATNSALGAVLTPDRVSATVTHDGIHPYGRNPEAGAWQPGVADSITPTWWAAMNPTYDASSNFRYAASRSAAYAAANGGVAPKLMATECGSDEADETLKSKYLLRRVASLWGLRVDPVIYALAQNNASFDLVDRATRTPRPSYYAVQRLMAAVRDLGVGGGPSAVATVAGWSYDTMPPVLVPIYGTGQKGLLLACQRTAVTRNTDYWNQLLAPPTRYLTLGVPPAWSVTVTDLADGSTVPVQRSGATVVVPLTDSLVAIRTTTV